MRLFLTLLLVFFLIAGPVAAISASPGSVAGAVKVSQAVKPVATIDIRSAVTIVTVPTTTFPPNLYGWVNISSTPSGAKVYFDDESVSYLTTPGSTKLYPGSHTVRLTHAGYKDYTTTVTIRNDILAVITAKLQLALNAGAIRQNVVTLSNTRAPSLINRTTLRATMTTPVPDTVCLSGEHCLTAADAALYYKPNSGYNVDEICGYSVTEDNQLIPKYCSHGTPSPITSLNCLSGEYCLTTDQADATLAAGWTLEMEDKGGVLCGWSGTEYEPLPQFCMMGTPKTSGLQPGVIQSMAVANQITRIPVSFRTTPTAEPGVTKKPLGGKRQISMADLFFGLFGGLFQHPSCPAGQTACGGTCVDTLTDSLNCGMCDYTCFDPAVCKGGECVEDYPFPPNPADDLL